MEDVPTAVPVAVMPKTKTKSNNIVLFVGLGVLAVVAVAVPAIMFVARINKQQGQIRVERAAQKKVQDEWDARVTAAIKAAQDKIRGQPGVLQVNFDNHYDMIPNYDEELLGEKRPPGARPWPGARYSEQE